MVFKPFGTRLEMSRLQHYLEIKKTVRSYKINLA